MTGARTKTMAKPPSRLDAPGVPSLLYLPDVSIQLKVTAAAHICVAKSLQTRQTQFGRLGRHRREASTKGGADDGCGVYISTEKRQIHRKTDCLLPEQTAKVSGTIRSVPGNSQPRSEGTHL
jgi:hypothetical protein